MAGAPTPYATAEGSLYELVSRGNKDSFFFSDDSESIYPFSTVYNPQIPQTSEIRRIPPKTACEFGRIVQFDIDIVGDILQDPTFVINLPSWLPSNVAATNRRSIVTDLSGVSYGYTNACAFFLFDLIQIYQDNILLQDFSGDALWAMSMSKGTYASKRVTNVLTGKHNGTALDIGWAATPGQLRLKIPLVGCQTDSDSGFPQRSVLNHTYSIKCKLRRLEDLVEASDGMTKPQPWNKVFRQSISECDDPQTFTTLKRTEIAPLKIELETTNVYVPNEYQSHLQQNPRSIHFVRIRENIFTQSAVDYTNVLTGGVSVVKRLIDGRHPSERVLWFFRSEADIAANRLWKLNTGLDGAQSYFSSVGLQVAGRDRELPRSSFVWRDITNFAKEQIDTKAELNTMNWGLGSILRPPNQVTGAVNFTSASKPSLYINLSDPNSDPLTELRIIVEGWARFDTDGYGRAELYSGN